MDNTNNFLNAVKKHSLEERENMLKEAQSYRREELEKARVRGEADADRYVTKLLSAAKAEVTSEYAVRNTEAKGELFRKRDKMVNDIFEEAKDRLCEFTKTPEYRERLIKDAKEIAEAFGSNPCVLYIREADLCFGDELKAQFNSDVELKSDLKILIGGVRGFCDSLKLVADSTLDSGLEAQREWFTENADLKINA